MTPSSMDHFVEAMARIRSTEARIGMIGLGYAGLPLALVFAEAGFPTYAFEREPARATALASGVLPFATGEPGLGELLTRVGSGGLLRISADRSILDRCDVFVVAVDTPVDADHRPVTDRLVDAVKAIAPRVRPGSVVVIESTVAPGTIDTVVIPLLTGSGLRVGDELFLLHCPERQRPGALLRSLRGTPRVLGGSGEQATELGRVLYGRVVQAPIECVDYRSAEVVKAAENTVRDVQIALANELAVVADAAGVDVAEVRRIVNRLWSAEPLVLEPGLGAGGNCLPKDPWLLVAGLARPQERSLVTGARAMNDGMAAHVATLAERALAAISRAVPGAGVAILGTAYKPEADDERNSRALALGAELERRGMVIRYHDTAVPARRAERLEAQVHGVDLVILAVAHRAYRDLDPVRLCTTAGVRAVLDVPRAWPGRLLREAGVHYVALGGPPADGEAAGRERST